MRSPVYMREPLARKKSMLFLIQAGLSGCALGAFTWLVTSLTKTYLPAKVPPNLYAWTYLYFHPVTGHRLNYLVLCILFGVIAMSIYAARTKQPVHFVEGRLASLPLTAVMVMPGVSVCLLFSILTFHLSAVPILIILGFVTCIPVLFFFGRAGFINLYQSRFAYGLLVTMTVSALVLAFYEHYEIIRGPVYLMNEYADIYADTKIDGDYVNNKGFLDISRQSDIDVLLERGRGSTDHPLTEYQILTILRSRYLISAYNYGRLADWAKSVTTSGTLMNNQTQNLDDPETKDVEVNRLRKFYLANYLEAYHQNMARGQVNHFGHVLNPVNEYLLGKPLRDIYMQYGLGNTFLMKWVMDLFGGISIQNYYKTYLFYPLYYLCYLAMLIYLFRNTLYVTGALASLVACFFGLGYIAYIIAPGIIPSIHLLDAATFTLFVMFLRREKRVYLSVAILLSFVAMVINRQFGIVLFLALIASTGLAIVESRRRNSKFLPLMGLSAALIIGIMVLKISDYGAFQTVFRYLWAGFFSWPAQNLIIVLTIIYLVVSYGFLLALRDKHFYLKYVYVFVFLYSQSTLLYYYWSGLINHLPPILPFLVLQLFIMLYILEKHLIDGFARLKGYISGITFSAALLIVLTTIPTAFLYYRQKVDFLANFSDHRIYRWDFKRATLFTTIDTNVMKESVGLIQKYSTSAEPRLYMISKYDGLLPFMSTRYSAFPIFDVSSYLFSQTEFNILVTQLQNDRPDYLFVDSDIYQFVDPWAKIYHSPFFQKERASRIGRYLLLAQLFDRVKNDYEKIEQGKLISVYKRKM